MKAIVTGGSGFIGSHVVDRLVHEGLKKVCKWFIMNYPNVRGVK